MCLIVNNPSGSPLLKIRLETAFANNEDGVGVMWHDRETGRVQSLRGMYNFEEFWDLHQMLIGTTHAIHLRYRTRCPVGENACHPFQILNEEEHGMDLYMMHNGTIVEMPNRSDASDTMLFADHLKAKLSTWENPFDFFRDNVLAKIEKEIGDNRLVFFGSGGLTAMINSKRGWFEDEEHGAVEMDTFDGMSTPIWYSNQYSFSGLDPKTWYTTPRVMSYSNSSYSWEDFLGKID